MNIQLRNKILEQSLQIEYEISNILAHIIRVDKVGSKTLSNKSSAIPFRVKVDFLYDLKRISKDDYNFLILFMEIRNQLIHNLEIDTLEKALTSIDKKQRFLNLDAKLSHFYDKELSIEKKEKLLGLILDSLYIRILNILREQIVFIIKDIDNEEQNRTNKISAENYKDFFNMLIESHKLVALKFVNTLAQNENHRKELTEILEALLYKEFKEKVETKFGQLDVD